MLVQTYNPGHDAITSAARHDYEAFYAHELAKRRENMYPPFARLVNVTISDEDEQRALEIWPGSSRTSSRQAAWQHGRGAVEFVGPAPAPLATPARALPLPPAAQGRGQRQPARGARGGAGGAGGQGAARLTVDVDPLDMM